jgi:catechol 2,3-dioxygenase-like lactoylglutathione lyase family enzyme
MMTSLTKLRVARPTNDIEEQLRFYRDGLGLEVLAQAEASEDFEGVVLGVPGGPWHLELTVAIGQVAPRAPTAEHLLVFYLPDRPAWETAVARLKELGFEPVPSTNPNWDRNGITFTDPDNYCVVLQNTDWTA